MPATIEDRDIERLIHEYQVTADPTIRARIVDACLPMTTKVAAKVAGKASLRNDLEIEDLAGYGALGLLHAIENFSEKHNLPFRVYCVLRIHAAIVDSLRTLDNEAREYRKQKQAEKRARAKARERAMAATRRLFPGEERDPSSAGCGGKFSPKRPRFFSLDAPISLAYAGSDETAWHEFIGDAGHGDPIEHLTREELADIATRILYHDCSDLERTILTLYFYDGKRLKEIGNIVGCTASGICKAIQRIIARLKARWGKRVDELLSER